MTRLSRLSLGVLLWIPCMVFAQSDLSPLQRPSRPMREAAQTHFQSGLRFFSRANVTPLSSNLKRRTV